MSIKIGKHKKRTVIVSQESKRNDQNVKNKRLFLSKLKLTKSVKCFHINYIETDRNESSN